MLRFDRTKLKLASETSVVAVTGPVLGCSTLASLVYCAGALDLAMYLSLALFGLMIYRRESERIHLEWRRVSAPQKRQAKATLFFCSSGAGLYYAKKYLALATGLVPGEAALSYSLLSFLLSIVGFFAVSFLALFGAALLMQMSSLLSRLRDRMVGRRLGFSPLHVEALRERQRTRDVVTIFVSVLGLCMGLPAMAAVGGTIRSEETYHQVRKIVERLDFDSVSLCENVQLGDKSMRLGVSHVFVSVRDPDLRFVVRACELGGLRAGQKKSGR